MLSPTQLIGIIIAISLTALLLVIGYQIIKILTEIRNTLHKINNIVDQAHIITKSIAGPVVSFSGFLSGLKDGASIVKLFTDNESTQKKKNA